ncbi:MAG: RHS repeat-associated core domain-containing protein, partial [Sneathiella sp.]
MSEMKQGDARLISPNESKIPGQAMGEFYPNNRTGAACYVLDIAVPPGVRGIEPSFALYYNSQEEKADTALGRGWRLVGLPTIQRKGASTFLQNGKKISLTRDGTGAFYCFDLDGTKTTYRPDKGGHNAILQACEISDLFGNKMLVAYDDNGLISSVQYGAQINQARFVDFVYDKITGLLSNIETRIRDKWVLNYKLDQHNGVLCAVSLSANDQNTSKRIVERDPITFEYDETKGLPNRLAFITEAPGLGIKLDYSDIAGVLSGYHRIVQRPFQKQSVYSYKIQSLNLTIDAVGEAYFEKLSLWNESEQTGQYWHYAAKGKHAGLLLTEGTFGGAQAVVEGEATYPCIDPKGDKIAHHYKMSESAFEYVWHKKGDAFIRSQKNSRLYVEPEKHLPVATKTFEYDEDGQLVRQTDATKTATREYINGPGPGNPRFLSRSSLYDTSTAKKLGSNNLLKDDKFDHKFDAKTGHIVSISHSIMIEAGIYSNPEISELDNSGHPVRLTSANGMITQTSYDKNHFATEETLSSKDGKKIVTQKTVREPAFGNVVYSKTFDGAITQQHQDPFGQLISISGFDSSAPSTWESDEGLTVRNSTETVYCQKFKSLVTKEIRAAQGDKGYLETRTVLDALFRPVIVMMEISPKRWSVRFTIYGSMTRETAVSLPVEISSTKGALAKTIRSMKRGKVLWVKKFWDAFGREAGVQNADGSGQRVVYSLSDAGDISVARIAITAQGEAGSCTEDAMDENGLVKTTNQGDVGPTQYVHDVLGQVVQKKDPSGQVTRYEWNSIGHCVLEDNPVTGLRRRKTDKSLQLVEESGGDTVVSYKYDWQGRITQKAFKARGQKERAYNLQYDVSPQNRSTSITATHPDGWATTLEFAPTGEEISRKVSFGPSYAERIETELYADGSVKIRHFPDGRSLAFQYSGAGWISHIGWENGSVPLVSFFDHDLNGRPRETRFANGVTERRTISDTGNMTHFSVMKEGAANTAPYINQEFTHLPGHMGLLDTADFSGNSERARREEYHYDALGRLDYVGGGKKLSGDYFRHGPAGNLSDFKRSDEMPRARLTDGLNHTVEIANENGIDWAFDYGDEGHCKSARGGDQAWEYFFGPDNALEKLVGERSGVSVESHCVSDAYGDRLVKADSTGDTILYVAPDFQITRKADGETLSTILLLSENGCVGEMTKTYGSNAKRKPFFKEFKLSSQKYDPPFGETLKVTARTPGQVFLHLDQRGSTILATGEQGVSLASLKFDAYGKIDEKYSSGTCSFTLSFAGMQIDTLTGLYFAGARYYSPDFLCFLSPDPNRSSTDPYAYPSDPINYFDFEGRCGWRDWSRSFARNLGRKATTVGQGVFAMAGGFLLYFAWDQATFGYDEGLAARWGLAIGFWFFQLATLSKSIGFCYNERRRICCQNHCGNSTLSVLASDLLRITCGAAIGTVWLGPLLSFIGNEDCSGWEMLNCTPEFYRMNAIRGCFPSIVAGVFAVGFRRLLERCSCSSNALISQYLTGVLGAWVGFAGWQGTDTLILYFGYGRTFPEIVAGKASFVSGEILFAFFLSQPNPFWGLLPALFNSSCLNERVWNRLFEEHGTFPMGHARAGDRIPWFNRGLPGVGAGLGAGRVVIALGPVPPLGLAVLPRFGPNTGNVHIVEVEAGDELVEHIDLMSADRMSASD